MSSKLDFLIPPPTQSRWAGGETGSPDGLSASHRSGSPECILMDEVSDLRNRVRTLHAHQKSTEAQLSELHARHTEHCDLLNSLCTDLGAYLEMESASSPILLQRLSDALARNRKDLVLIARRAPPAAPIAPPVPAQAPPAPTPPVTPPVTAVPDDTAQTALAVARQNKSAIDRLEADVTEQRVSFRTQLAEIEARLTGQVDSVKKHLDSQLSQLREDLEARLARRHDSDKAGLAAVKGDIDERVRQLEQSTTKATEALRLDLAALKRGVPDVARHEAAALDEVIRSDLLAQRRRAADLEQQVAQLTRKPEPTIPDVTPQLDQLNARVQRVESALDSTRDEHEAATFRSSEREKRYLDLRAEVDRLTRALEVHTDAIHEMQNRASLEGSFNEVKDWLLDLEKRVMTRGEMHDITQRFDAELADVRLDLTKRVSLA